MTHLTDENIAQLIDGAVTQQEREQFKNHLSQCDTCLTVYTETAKFMEAEGAQGAQPDAQRPFTMQVLTNRRFALPAAAVLVIAVLLVSFFLDQSVYNKIERAQIASISERAAALGGSAFSGSSHKKYAAARAGILVEQLDGLTGAEDADAAKQTIEKRFSDELTIIFQDGAGSIFPIPAPVKEADFDTAVESLQQGLTKHALLPVFQMGRFLEHTLLDTFKGQPPQQEDIETYLNLAREQGFPPEFIEQLSKLKPDLPKKDIHQTCNDAEEILFSHL